MSPFTTFSSLRNILGDVGCKTAHDLNTFPYIRLGSLPLLPPKGDGLRSSTVAIKLSRTVAKKPFDTAKVQDKGATLGLKAPHSLVPHTV